ncbi:hypothetical protein Tco_0993793 [Tanacetum coccineum]
MEMHNAFNQQYGHRPHMPPSPNPIPSQSTQRFSPSNSLDIEDDVPTRSPLFSSRKEASFEYVRIKEQELELERLKLAQAEKFEE